MGSVSLAILGGAPSSVVFGGLAGGQNPYPRILLDNYYDSSAYANKSAAINAAVAAAQALGGVLEFRHGRTYSLDTTFMSIAPGLPLRIVGNGATLQSNWGSQHMIDFTRTADYQTFADINCDGLTCDANNQSSGHNESVIGNLSAGAWGQRSNFDRIEWTGKIINAPVGGGSTVTEGFAIAGKHLASAETQTHIRNVRVKLYIRGCDVGFAAIGTGVSGATNAGVEVYHDQIFYDVDHDTGVTPTNTSSGGANVQIGSVGWGDYCEGVVRGANSGDVGVEIDGMMTSICRGTIIDAKNCAFYARNFHPPRSVTAQKNTFRDCVAISRNVDKGSTTGTAKDYAIGGDSTTSFAFGEYVMENCQSQCETALAAWSNSTAMFLSVDQMYAKRLRIIGTYRIGCTALAMAAPANGVYIFNNIWLADPRAVVDIDGISIELAGTLGIANSGIVLEGLRTSTTSNNTTKVDIGQITFDASGITSAATNNTLKVIHMGVNASSFFTGRIRGIKATNGSVGSWTAMGLLYLNTNFHVGGAVAANNKFAVDGVDSALWTSSAGSDITYASSSQWQMLAVRSVTGRRTTGAIFGAPTSISPGASPYTYQNSDAIAELVSVSGGTVSDISASHDNSTFFTLGQTAGMWHVEPGDYLKVTYSAPPAMTKFPLA